MKLSEKKDRFLKILRERYKRQEEARGELEAMARLEKTVLGYELPSHPLNRIEVSSDELKKEGILDNDLWKVVCPSLLKQGILKSYKDPELYGDTESHIFFINEDLIYTKEEGQRNPKSLKKVEIVVDEEKKEIVRMGSKSLKYAFRKTGRNKRFEYLLKIVQNPKVGAHKLSDNIQTLSSEIKKINQLIQKKLRLKKPLVINQGNSGYEVDEDTYDISII